MSAFIIILFYEDDLLAHGWFFCGIEELVVVILAMANL